MSVSNKTCTSNPFGIALVFYYDHRRVKLTSDLLHKIAKKYKTTSSSLLIDLKSKYGHDMRESVKLDEIIRVQQYVQVPSIYIDLIPELRGINTVHTDSNGNMYPDKLDILSESFDALYAFNQRKILTAIDSNQRYDNLSKIKLHIPQLCTDEDSHHLNIIRKRKLDAADGTSTDIPDNQKKTTNRTKIKYTNEKKMHILHQIAQNTIDTSKSFIKTTFDTMRNKTTNSLNNTQSPPSLLTSLLSTSSSSSSSSSIISAEIYPTTVTSSTTDIHTPSLDLFQANSDDMVDFSPTVTSSTAATTNTNTTTNTTSDSTTITTTDTIFTTNATTNDAATTTTAVTSDTRVTSISLLDSPYSLIYSIMLDKVKAQIMLRRHPCVHSTMIGYIRAYDRHFNLVLTDVDEIISYQKYLKSKDVVYKTKTTKRYYPQIILRGDSVVWIRRIIPSTYSVSNSAFSSSSSASAGHFSSSLASYTTSTTTTTTTT